jgi:hypothetical protein
MLLSIFNPKHSQTIDLPLPPEDQKSQLRLKLMIAPQQFGTCQLQLRGLQSA